MVEDGKKNTKTSGFWGYLGQQKKAKKIFYSKKSLNS